MLIFLQGFAQIFFIAVNTYFIAREKYLLVFICSFIISILWANNVSKISLGKRSDKLIYSTGAALGGLTGLYLSKHII